MKVKDFIEEKKCGKSGLFRFMETEDKTSWLLTIFLQEVCYIAQRVSKGNEITEDMLGNIRLEADQRFQELLEQLNPEWVGGSEHQLENKRNLMRKFYLRFMGWFLDYLLESKVEDTAVRTSLSVTDECREEPVLLEEVAHIILKKGGGYVAVVLNVGKNFEKRSINGRKPATQIEADLRYAVLKTCLEEQYSGINICAVFFQEGETKGEVLPWVCNDTQKSNVFFMPYLGFYDAGRFDAALCLSNAETSLNEYACKPQTVKCAGCIHKADCQMQTYSNRRPSEKGKLKEWKFPEYDEMQRHFVEFGEKEVLVLAGPGAGKTSATIGRVNYLRSMGVPTERMLLISYTEKAASEILDRLYGKYPEDEMPRVGTLHSVAREIISLYERSKGVTQRKRLLTLALEKRILKNVLDEIPQLSGVDYRNYLKGRFCTINTVYSGLKQMQKDSESFFSKYHDYVPCEWEKVQKAVDTLRKEENYISYDEQILLASDIMKQDKDIRDYYHQKYDYIMVDEYQDINAEQEELISLLESEKKNLACIGDDDQAIYGFKGCSSRYMLQFMQRHQGASLVKLTKNYRSTRAIVEFNNSILRSMEKGQRIEKLVEYTDFAKEGMAPVLIDGNNAEDVKKLIEEALADGYSYGDIAVIATKNDSLSVLHDSLDVPTELASAYVSNDFLFHVVLNTLSIVLGKDTTKNSYYRLGLLFEKNSKWFESVANGDVSEGDIGNLLVYAEKQKQDTAEHYVARLSAFLDMDDSVSEREMLGIVRNNGAVTLEELHQIMSDIVLFGDDKKLEYPSQDRVTLITAHSCKGKEWPVVIVYDTDSFKGEISVDSNDSMDLRLFYVSASRAKERLIFMKSEGKPSIVDENLLVKPKKMAS